MAGRKLTEVQLLRRAFERCHAAEMKLVDKASNEDRRSLERAQAAIDASNRAREAWRAAYDAEEAAKAAA